MNFLNFPDDILVEIFRWLDGDSVFSCSMASKTLHSYLQHHREFEYRYRLEKQALIDTCGGERSYESRINVLKDFTHQWWWAQGWRMPTEVYEVEGRCIAYELVAGVFAKTDGSSFTVQWIPSFVTPGRQVVRTGTQLGFAIKDFALDPTQDVVVFIEADQLPLILPHGREIILHFRTLSTNVPHPSARQPTIKFNIPYNPLGNDLSSVTVQLADDLLSIFFTSGPRLPCLLLWDWRSMTNILNSMNPGLHLPPGSHSFEIISSRSYAILSTADGGSIYIYNIEYPTRPLTPPFCVARLMLPQLLPRIALATIQSHTGPFLSQPRRDGIFTTSPDARVYVIAARFLNTTRTHATFFIHGSAFAVYSQLKDRPEDKPPEIPWAEWSRRKCFFAPVHLSTNWLRYVQGTRIVMAMDQDRGQVTVLDFNLNRDLVEEAPRSNFDLFTEDIRHVLPPRTRGMTVTSSCSSWMIDEDYILGLNTTGSFEERIRSLEVYSMYPTRNVGQQDIDGQ